MIGGSICVGRGCWAILQHLGPDHLEHLLEPVRRGFQALCGGLQVFGVRGERLEASLTQVEAEPCPNLGLADQHLGFQKMGFHWF